MFLWVWRGSEWTNLLEVLEGNCSCFRLEELELLGEIIGIRWDMMPLGERMRECYYELMHGLVIIFSLISVVSSESGIYI